MIVVTHGASDWARDLNRQITSSATAPPRWPFSSAAASNSPISWSRRAAISWAGCSERGWRLPRDPEVVQNVVPVAEATAPADALVLLEIDEIVFFGRQEARKGVDVFCEAVEALDRSPVGWAEPAVTFLGKFSRMEGVHSGVFLMERTRGIGAVAPRILANLGQEEALDYLKRPGVAGRDAVARRKFALRRRRMSSSRACRLSPPPAAAAGELIAEEDRAASLVAKPEERRAGGQAQRMTIAQGASVRASLAEPQALHESALARADRKPRRALAAFRARDAARLRMHIGPFRRRDRAPRARRRRGADSSRRRNCRRRLWRR